MWRRRRDSNSRTPLRVTRFPIVRARPATRLLRVKTVFTFNSIELYHIAREKSSTISFFLENIKIQRCAEVSAVMHCPPAGGGDSGSAFLMPIDRQTRDFAYADCAAPAIWLKTGEADTTGMMHPAIMDEECRERGERGAHYGGTRRGTFCDGVGGGTLHAHHAIRKIRNVPETVSRTSHRGWARRENTRSCVRWSEFRCFNNVN